MESELAIVFESVEGLTFEPAQASLARAQLRAVRASIKGLGRVEFAAVRSVEDQEGSSAIVTVAVLDPIEGSSSTRDVFRALLNAIAASGEASRALKGQALLVTGTDFQIVVTPVAMNPALLVLMITGPVGTPVVAIADKLFASLSAAIS